jgi:transposase-like protein
MEAPSSLIKFHKQFADEQACIDYLAKERWGEDATCPKCGVISVKFYKLKSGKLKCATCRQAFSVRVGTIFEDSKLPLEYWFVAIYLSTSLKKGISSIQLSKYLDITQKSAWFMLQRIRHVFDHEEPPLEGIVEVDETYIGGKHPRSLGRSKKEIVFGMVERSGRAKLIHVKSSGARSLLPEIAESITHEATIYSDTWRAYSTLNKRGFAHESVNHSKHEYARGPVNTNTVEGLWSHFKKSLDCIYIHVSGKHLKKYCDEFDFRYSTREMTDGERFQFWFRFISGKHVSYAKLIK